MAVAASMEIYQLKISLKRFKPPIWRRVQMPKDSTFKALHHVIVDCMSWSNIHLHVFRKPRPRSRSYDEIEEIEFGTVPKDKNTGKERAYIEQFGVRIWNEKLSKLSDYFEASKDSIDYAYDLGFSWNHVIVLEKILSSVPGKVYPVCVAGRRGHPKEDPTEEEYDNDDWETEVFDPKSVKFTRFDTKEE